MKNSNIHAEYFLACLSNKKHVFKNTFFV